MNGSRRSMIPMLEDLQNSAEKLMQYLQKEYHLD
jgi:hypothetical protein